MANRNDAAADALLQRAIDHLRKQPIPDFPNPEFSALKGSTPNISSAHPTSFLWRMVMNRRFQLSAGALVGTAALLGFILLWGGIDAKPVSAMEQMAENVRKAKSYKYNLTVRINRDSPEPGVPAVSEHSHVIYKLAPGTSRIDSIDSPDWKGPGPECTEIHPIGSPGIAIDHKDREFRRLQPRPVNAISGDMDDLQNLGNFSGKADRELGTKDINGKRARGFQIDLKKITDETGAAEIWLDGETALPLLVYYEVRMPGRTFHDVISNIQWSDLDPKLFDTTPPDGYADKTPTPPTVRE